MLRLSRGMRALNAQLLQLWRCRSGATAIEYGLIASLIVVVCLAAIQAIGANTAAMWEVIRAAIAN